VGVFYLPFFVNLEQSFYYNNSLILSLHVVDPLLHYYTIEYAVFYRRFHYLF
jgi:hypothetical protein